MRIIGNEFFRLAFVAVLAAVLGNQAYARAAPAGGDAQWQPNRPALHSQDYAGAAACATCHPAQSKKQATSEMGLSVTRPADTRLLASHPEMSFQRGKYTYSLISQGGQITFTATDGRDKITEPVFVAVGSGEVFQAYLIQHNGEFYRAPVDFYAAQDKLGSDPDADPALPATLETALGKHLSQDDVRGCFRCHSPASVSGDQLDLASRTPGIHCEVCHGPGAGHVAARRGEGSHGAEVFNPARLRPEAQADFCDSCHESASNMKKENPHGVRSVVSPEYRLQQSRCFRATDARSSCFACHDPHAPMERKTVAYDSKCLACHAVRGNAALASQPGKSCPVGSQDCAGCHMAKVPVPNSAILFTDHHIRIVAAGAPFPE
jgi:hypothetical protein